MVRAKGTVTYEDGSLIPAERMVFTFVPTAKPEDKLAPPRGVAEVNVADGTFSAATSHKFSDGIVAGTHKVLILALDANQNPTPAVPAIYRSPETTPLQVEANESPFQFQIPKP